MTRMTESQISVWYTFLSCFTDTITATRREKLSSCWPDCGHDTSCYIHGLHNSKHLPQENGINFTAHNHLYLCGHQNNYNLLCLYVSRQLKWSAKRCLRPTWTSFTLRLRHPFSVWSNYRRQTFVPIPIDREWSLRVGICKQFFCPSSICSSLFSSDLNYKNEITR